MHVDDSCHVPFFRGVPRFFQACCWTASAGGDFGYEHPGRELSRHLDDLEPMGLSPNAWIEEVDKLLPLVEKRDDDAILRWFVVRYPNCLALVPKRRRSSFLSGAYVSLRERFGID